jgi:EAL domain-containing protein (putative c-di-GMP-specific phosphodiesterase class I)
MIEITESAIMVDPDGAMKSLVALHAAGVWTSIDDFGTGYSSLGYLKHLPVDEIKIDKSFVLDMATNRDDVSIVRSVVTLGHNLGLKVVAEGVDNKRTLDMLGAMDCDMAQGFTSAVRCLHPRCWPGSTGLPVRYAAFPDDSAA